MKNPSVVRTHAFPDRTKLNVLYYSGPKKTRHYVLSWRVTPEESESATFRVPIAERDLHQWLAEFPEDERAKMYKNLKLTPPKEGA